MSKLIAITGGIGAGKSVVSRVLRTLGYQVFDCDIEARRIMDNDPDIKQRLASEISPDVIVAGKIDRPRLATLVFNSPQKLATLNSITHTAVKNRLMQWCKLYSADKILFVETALLYTSGLNRLVDAEWRVEAPADLRVERVMQRNGLSPQKVMERINAQQAEISGTAPHPPLSVIMNDNCAPVLPQISKLLTNIP